MEKIEYSDLNKFLVSVGVALMTISILIVWLFFSEPFDLLLEQKTIDNLTETAKIIILIRQGQVNYLLYIIPWAALILFLLGLTSLIIGLIRRLKKQRLLDERDELTKPNTPKTNGMVERLNETIKNIMVKINQYAKLGEMQSNLTDFLINYNLSGRHSGLRKELNVKAPVNAGENRFELEHEILKKIQYCLKIKFYFCIKVSK